MARQDDDTVIVEPCVFKSRTLKAVRIEADGEEFWIPKSLIINEWCDGIEVPRWFAEEKELPCD